MLRYADSNEPTKTIGQPKDITDHSGKPSDEHLNDWSEDWDGEDDVEDGGHQVSEEINNFANDPKHRHHYGSKEPINDFHKPCEQPAEPAQRVPPRELFTPIFSILYPFVNRLPYFFFDRILNCLASRSHYVLDSLFDMRCRCEALRSNRTAGGGLLRHKASSQRENRPFCVAQVSVTAYQPIGQLPR
jgi:hypothetical protein